MVNSYNTRTFSYAFLVVAAIFWAVFALGRKPINLADAVAWTLASVIFYVRSRRGK
jgi:hypothetical protein